MQAANCRRPPHVHTHPLSFAQVYRLFCRSISSCHWSPAGRVILLAGLDSNAGALEFFNADDMATLRTQAHFLANNVAWDSSGRYVCSWVDDARDMEHGFVVWSFAGELLYRCDQNLVM